MNESIKLVKHKNIGRFLIGAIICIGLIITPSQNYHAEENTFERIQLQPPPQALFVYTYGTPIYSNVPQEKLHTTLFHLSTGHTLNLYNTFLPANTNAYFVGQDFTSSWFLVLIEGESQLAWIPLIEVKEPEKIPYANLIIFYHDNMPRYDGKITVP